MGLELSDRTKYFIKLIIVTVTVYFSIKYLLPLFLPFLVAILVVHFLKPIVIKIHKKTKIKKNLVAIISLFIVTGIIAIIFGIIIANATNQVKNIVSNYDKYQNKLSDITDETCCIAEKYSGINSDEIRKYIDEEIGEMISKGKTSDVLYKAMNKSIDTVILFGEWIVGIFTSIISAYYLLVSENKEPKNLLIKELKSISSSVGRVCIAYIKTQLVIMSITSVLCFICFIVIKNNYALVLALLVGFLDALPLIGIGIILVPWGLVYIFMGNYFKAGIILGTFILCYIVREFAEPKLMGHQIGITPLATIISMYVGYKVFGIIGVIVGPIAYILIETLMENRSI